MRPLPDTPEPFRAAAAAPIGAATSPIAPTEEAGAPACTGAVGRGSPIGAAAVISGQVPARHAPRPLSVRDVFRVGIGPSSSHTVGPMRAGRHFATCLAEALTGQPSGDDADAALAGIGRLVVDLMGSLGATGKGHSTDRAVMLGLAGHRPESVPIGVVDSIMDDVEATGVLPVPGVGEVRFLPGRDIRFLPGRVLPFHVNALTIAAYAETGETLCEKTYYSVGGGFVMVECGDPEGRSQVRALASSDGEASATPAPYPYARADQLLETCERAGLRISDVVMANECAVQPGEAVNAALDAIAEAMRECIDAGCSADGVLPGGLRVQRRARRLLAELEARAASARSAGADAAGDPMAGDPMAGMDWVNLYALAVNEENAAGHRVVTAPTNGAAGVVPAVLAYYRKFMRADREGVRRFLLAAAAIGGLIKANASIAGAEVGCQGEVGSASAMAAAGLAEVMGGRPRQVENAAEIAMEHSLGLTCDPVGGLVQIPCIERNALAAVKAVNAARMAMWGDGRHAVSFDAVIETMRRTGRDMLSKYKETSLGGLAVCVVEC